MNFYNINNPSEKADLKKAVLTSLPKTPGLYMPENLPVMTSDFIKNLGNFSQQVIAFEVTKTMLGSDETGSRSWSARSFGVGCRGFAQ